MSVRRALLFPAVFLLLTAAAARAEVTLVAPGDYATSLLDVGDVYYLDRTHTITDMPAQFATYTAVMTKNDDKSVTDLSHITLTTNASATVYVAYDNRASGLPDWMSGFSDTHLNIETTDVSLDLYEETYAAGTITLGGNLASGAAGAQSNYIVFISTTEDVVTGTYESGVLGDCPMPPFIVAEDVRPNVLIILDHSGSMNSNNKWSSAKSVVIDLLDTFPSVRFGLMRMDGSDTDGNDTISVEENIIRQGGKILKPCGTDVDEIKSYIKNWGSANDPQTWTVLAETLASAGQYFATVEENGTRVGMGPEGFGFYDRGYTMASHGVSATNYDDNGNAVDTTSPIEFYCQQSFVIFITDGLSNNDSDWPVVNSVIGNYDTNDGGDGSHRYFDDVALYLNEKDMRSDLAGTQNIVTYVVGFQIADSLLERAASNGGGKYYTPTTSEELAADLQDALADILAKISSGTAVSTISTSAQSDDYLIRARFLPANWWGYLEAFTLPLAEIQIPEWEAGALLSQRLPSERTIKTVLEGAMVDLVSTNTDLKAALSSEWEMNATETGKVINYVRGFDTDEGAGDDDFRQRGDWLLGDIVYSTPASVTAPIFPYRENGYQTFKKNHADRETVIYVGANDGMLHAFNATNGEEIWAYVPGVVLPKLPKLTEKDCHDYSVDLTPRAADVYDGTQWRTVLLGGQRLGGDGYFCLDVTQTDPEQVEVLWDMIPFSSRKSSVPASWGKFQWEAVNGTLMEKWLAVIPSGYHEGPSPGKIAAFDFQDGSKESIWSNSTHLLDELATQNRTKSYFSMSPATVADLDDDTYVDLIYAGDTEGTLWKFYYDYANRNWRQTRFFETGGQPITAAPDLSLDGDGRLHVSFGTGRFMVTSDKNDSVRNSFYSLVDEKVAVTVNGTTEHHFMDTTTVTRSDLVDLTTVTNATAFSTLGESDQTAVQETGWFFDLDNSGGNPSERVVEPAVTVAGVVFFVSFTPTDDVCAYGGQARLFAVDFVTGIGTSALNEPDTDRYKVLGAGLPSKPVYSFDPQTRSNQLYVQTSDATIHVENINVEYSGLGISSWRRNW